MVRSDPGAGDGSDVGSHWRLPDCLKPTKACINQVCPYFFRVQVAVVKKAGFAQTGSQAP